MKKILLTWVAWFIWSNLAEELLSKWYFVVWLDNLMTWHMQNIENLMDNKNFVFIKDDVRDLNKLDEIIKKYEIKFISHQAARWSVPKSVENPILTNDININWTLNILEVAKNNKLKKIVVAISSSVYWDTPELPKVETMPYNPLSPYATTKVTKEIYLKNFWNLYWLPTIWLRYFNVYGRRQDPNWDYAAVIPRWIYKALNNEDLPLNWEWTQTRDFTYIDDVIQANIKAIETENTKAFWKWYNICFWQQISIKELWEEIIKVTSSNWKIIKAPARKWDINDSYWDWSLANKMFWYFPKYNMETWLKETLKWYSDNKNYFNK